ncbi:MAG: hypothetical protein CV087_09895 [Candidatus Brocadia sp. WS118]|nr:MAG: hypothetical protein CV087_09895 [Candidatus Brocadia sp. WS118]
MNKEQRLRYYELVGRGMHLDQIARELGVSTESMIKYSMKRLGELLRSEEIEFDPPEDAFERTVTLLVEIISRNLKTIVEDLEKRDLSGVPKPEMVKMFFKHYNKMYEEFDPAKYRKKREDKF